MRRIGWTVLLVLLAANLWQAPVPYVHCHEQEAVPSQAFAQHLAIYHPDGDDGGGWHFHFATIRDILRGAGCPVPSDSDDESEPYPWLVTNSQTETGHGRGSDDFRPTTVPVPS